MASVVAREVIKVALIRHTVLFIVLPEVTDRLDCVEISAMWIPVSPLVTGAFSILWVLMSILSSMCVVLETPSALVHRIYRVLVVFSLTALMGLVVK
jgi:hypothetical protein